MYRILLLGAGKIGSAIAQFLSNTGDYDVLVGDADEASLKRVTEIADVKTVLLERQRFDRAAGGDEGPAGGGFGAVIATDPNVASAPWKKG